MRMAYFHNDENTTQKDYGIINLINSAGAFFAKRWKEVCLIALIFYVIFLFYLTTISAVTPDEGNHALLGKFYLDLFKYIPSNFSPDGIYNYAIGYLIDFPKLSVYYPPLTHFSLAGMFAVFGSSFLAARITIILIAIFSIIAVYKFSKYLFGRKTALLSTVVFASSPLVIFLSRGIFIDLMSNLLFVLSILYFMRAIESGKKKDYAYAGIVAAFGLLTKWFFLFVYPIVFLYSIFSKSPKKKYLILSFILSFVLVSPYLFFGLKYGFLLSTFKSSIGVIGSGITEGDPQFTSIAGWLYYLNVINENIFSFPLSLLALIGLIFYFRSAEKYKALFFTWIISVYVLLTLIPNKDPRSAIYLVAPLSISAVLGFKHFLRNSNLINSNLIRGHYLKVPAFALVLFVLFALLIYNLYSSISMVETYDTFDREVSDFIAESGQPVYTLSETGAAYPASLMFRVASLDRRIKFFRVCALALDNASSYNETMYNYGIKWIIHDTEGEYPYARLEVLENLKNMSLISLEKNIGPIEIYSYNFYNENPSDVCNKICLTDEKICPRIDNDIT